MTYPSYEEYRKPEIDSIDNIPSHWKEKKFRFIFTLGRGLGITKADLVDEGIPCINYGEIHSKYGFEVVPENQNLKFVVEKYLEDSSASLLNNGDFVFADTSEDLEGSGNFTYLNSEIPTFAGYHTVIARPTGGDLSRFLAYFIDSSIYRSQIRKSVSGVKVFSVTQAILKDSYVWLPPIREQEKIAAFLDYKTQKIDQLIEKKKALIETLEEKRIAVISQAVTKGLDENVKLKPSGFDWLGDVPDHWLVTKLKYFATIHGGYAFSSDSFQADGIQLLRIGNVYQNRLALKRQPSFLDESFVETHKGFVINRGDIIMSLTGTLGKTDYGYAVQVDKDGPFMLNQRVARITAIEHTIAQEYLIYAIRSESYLKQLYSLPSGTKQANLSNDNVTNIPISVPSTIEEQIAISTYISDQLAKIDKMSKANHLTIKKLEEFRSAIITLAVTGEIDVRAIEILKERA
jgi:type I restriction enzyme S subunit